MRSSRKGVPALIKGISANSRINSREDSKIEFASPKVQMKGSRICMMLP